MKRGELWLWLPSSPAAGSSICHSERSRGISGFLSRNSLRCVGFARHDRSFCRQTAAATTVEEAIRSEENRYLRRFLVPEKTRRGRRICQSLNRARSHVDYFVKSSAPSPGK